jgi:uncharacterized protein (DUF885 family)
MKMRSKAHALVLVLVSVCAAALAQVRAPVAELEALFDEAWEYQLREYPTLATSVGDHRYDDRLGSVSVEDATRRDGYWRDVRIRLDAIDRTRLDAVDRINFDIFKRQLEDRHLSFEFSEFLIPITSDWSFHNALASLPRSVPLRTAQDYENYIARLKSFARVFEQNTALMRRGMATGFCQPKVVLEGYESYLEPHIVDDVTRSVFFGPFEGFPPTISAADRTRLREAGEEAISSVVIPSFRSFLKFMVEEYIPGARDTVGASELPDGSAYYAWCVRKHTTLDSTPEEIHRIGLAEVERIRGEMQSIIDQLGFQGDFEDFLDFLRTDPRFFMDSPEAYLKEARDIAKRMDGKLPSLFKTLPRTPYGVEPVPEHLGPKFTAGRYVRAPIGGTSAGTYWVNTYALDSRPLWALPALTLHEAVPGHHLQIALNQELEGLPNFRRFSYVNAFGEGWGLYSERLGVEAGMYRTPYEHFGRLTYEMWRACRLVVDTGIHAKGWSRDQAMEYLAANTALSLHEIATEIDRYISWPGQALSYKMGELTIRRLRAEAEAALGEQFDVREFHDVVLRNGSVPLDLLEGQVRDWIEQRLPRFERSRDVDDAGSPRR